MRRAFLVPTTPSASNGETRIGIHKQNRSAFTSFERSRYRWRSSDAKRPEQRSKSVQYLVIMNTRDASPGSSCICRCNHAQLGNFNASVAPSIAVRFRLRRLALSDASSLEFNRCQVAATVASSVQLLLN
jgi:hypothetical protein